MDHPFDVDKRLARLLGEEPPAAETAGETAGEDQPAAEPAEPEQAADKEETKREPARGREKEKKKERKKRAARRREEQKAGIHEAQKAPGRPKKRRKYRLRPEAKRFYLRLLAAAGALVLAIVVLKLTVFRTTFRLENFNPEKPFNVSEQLLDVVSPKKKDNLIVLDAAVRANNAARIDSIELSLCDVISEKHYREWTLEIERGRSGELAAKVYKGKKYADNYTALSSRFPALATTLETLSRIPFSEIGVRERLTDQQHFEFSTAPYRPDINPPVSERARKLDAKPILVSVGGELSDISVDWKPIVDYVAIDCSVAQNKPKEDEKPQLRYIVLLATRLY